jgi:thioesterase domain-containing protein/acyl carrier protein
LEAVLEGDRGTELLNTELRGDDVGAKIVGLFQAAFQNPAIGPDDNFFEIGGDSLLAEAVISGIEQRFDVVLPVSVIIEAPTPRLLAEAVGMAERDERPGIVVRIRNEGAGTPVFCIHGMDGETTFYRKLGGLLPPGQPVFGIRAYGLQKGEIPIRSLVRMASNYLGEIEAIQPEGPYFIIGQCGASVVAYEIAQQLRARGKEVAGLVLLDPTVSELPWLTTSGMDLVLKRSEIIERAEQTSDAAFLDPTLNGEQRRKMVYLTMYGVVAGYTPKPYPGKVLMPFIPIHARALLDRKRGIPALVPDLEAIEIPGGHMEMFERKADILVGEIARFMGRIAERSAAG